MMKPLYIAATTCLVLASGASSVSADDRQVVLDPRTHSTVGVVAPSTVEESNRTYILDARTHAIQGVIVRSYSANNDNEDDCKCDDDD